VSCPVPSTRRGRPTSQVSGTGFAASQMNWELIELEPRFLLEAGDSRVLA